MKYRKRLCNSQTAERSKEHIHRYGLSWDYEYVMKASIAVNISYRISYMLNALWLDVDYRMRMILRKRKDSDVDAVEIPGATTTAIFSE